MDKRDDEPEQRQFSDKKLLDIVAQNSPASTSEVANELGVTRRAVNHRLKMLVEDGRIQNKKVGRSWVWFNDCK